MSERRQPPSMEDAARELEALRDAPPLELELDAPVAWMIMAAIQLACRHPGNSGPVRQVSERFARELQARIALTPALAALAEMGWDASYDSGPEADNRAARRRAQREGREETWPDR